MIRKEELKGDDARLDPKRVYFHSWHKITIQIVDANLVVVAVAPPPLPQLTLEGGDHPLRAGLLLVRPSSFLLIFSGALSGFLGLAPLGGALFSLILQEVDVTIFVLDCLVVLKGGQPC